MLQHVTLHLKSILEPSNKIFPGCGSDEQCPGGYHCTDHMCRGDSGKVTKKFEDTKLPFLSNFNLRCPSTL